MFLEKRSHQLYTKVGKVHHCVYFYLSCSIKCLKGNSHNSPAEKKSYVVIECECSKVKRRTVRQTMDINKASLILVLLQRITSYTQRVCINGSYSS